MPLIYDTAAGAFIEAETPLVNVGGVWQDSVGNICKDGVWEQVWPTKVYLIQDGLLNSALGSLNSSIYFNATGENTTQQTSNNASFSQSGGYAVFSGKGFYAIEARGFLLSTGNVIGRKKLIIECIGECSIGASVCMGVITDTNYTNLIKNTKRYYRNENMDFAYSAEQIRFGEGYVKPTSALTSYELDVSSAASEKLHLFVKAIASGATSYYCNIRVKNMYLI